MLEVIPENGQFSSLETAHLFVVESGVLGDGDYALELQFSRCVMAHPVHTQAVNICILDLSGILQNPLQDGKEQPKNLL